MIYSYQNSEFVAHKIKFNGIVYSTTVVVIWNAYFLFFILQGCQADLHHDMIAADDEAREQKKMMWR